MNVSELQCVFRSCKACIQNFLELVHIEVSELGSIRESVEESRGRYYNADAQMTNVSEVVRKVVGLFVKSWVQCLCRK